MFKIALTFTVILRVFTKRVMNYYNDANNLALCFYCFKNGLLLFFFVLSTFSLFKPPTLSLHCLIRSLFTDKKTETRFLQYFFLLSSYLMGSHALIENP